MRTLFSIGLFLAAAMALPSTSAIGQPKAQPDPKVKNKYAPPAPVKPDAVMLKAIAEKTARLKEAVEALKVKKIPDDVLVEVAVYLKAAENIVKFEEWFHKDSGKWTLATLDRGLQRAAQAVDGKATWRENPGKWTVRAYRSKVDGSIQPYAVLLPHDYGKDPKKAWRLDLVLHGRDSTITEPKFLATHDTAGKEAPKDQSYVQLEVYGRGNNAYRWAGEADVNEAANDFASRGAGSLGGTVDPNRVVLRGFSMGGAGSWHLGLHHPMAFAVVGPGAGFTTTHGYIKDLPNPLPDYQENCLTIYDAIRYAENAFDVPIVAYSGEKDGQKLAADNIEKLVRAYPENLRFTHLVAPGLEHQMPAEWQAKAQAEYQKYVGPGQSFPERVHFVTHTLRFNDFGWGRIEALDEHYKRAVVDGTWNKSGLTLKTENVRILHLVPPAEIKKWATTSPPVPTEATIDGQKVTISRPDAGIYLVKDGGGWHVEDNAGMARLAATPFKAPGLQGPIDDAFMDSFVVVGPTSKGISPTCDASAKAAMDRFAREWEKWMRGKLPVVDAETALKSQASVILFGDPVSNPLIAKLLPKNVTWTSNTLQMGGESYDPATHLPVLIQPNPLNPKKYVVINSGHTFHEADFKGTNALLYPRLGDWAVLKPAPTPKDPAAAEVVKAGLFDEFWRFPKK